jgi:hypothetical protein
MICWRLNLQFLENILKVETGKQEKTANVQKITIESDLVRNGTWPDFALYACSLE